MTAQIIVFRLRKRPDRNQAMRWLCAKLVEFPKATSVSIGDDLFFGWRFVRALDGVVYFANCINAGISEDDLKRFKQNELRGEV